MRFVLAILLVVFGLAAHAQTEDDDRGFIQGLLEDALSTADQQVELRGFRGALSSRATVDRIRILDADGAWLVLEDIVMEWDRSALLRGRVDIGTLSAARLVVDRPPLPPEAALPTPEARARFALPELPVSVAIADLQVDDVLLRPAIVGQEVRLSVAGNVSLAGGAGQGRLTLDRLDRAGQFSVEGGFANATNRLTIDLSLEEPDQGLAATLLDIPDRPGLRLRLQGDDPLDDFRASLRFDTDNGAQVAGDLRVTTDRQGTTVLGLDVQGDVSAIVTAQYREFLGDDVSLQANATRTADGSTRLDELSLASAALTLDGQAQLTPEGWPTFFDLDIALTPPDGERVLLPFAGDGTTVTRGQIHAEFDATRNNRWRMDGQLTDPASPDFTAQSVVFDARGIIDTDARFVSGRMALDGAQITLAQAALGAAVGPSLTAAFQFEWARDLPFVIKDIDAQGNTYGITGTAVVDGTDADQVLWLRPDITLVAQDLSQFSALSGLDLAGQADAAIKGDFAPLTGQAEVAITAQTQRLRTGIAQLDPLLGASTELAVGLLRDETGITIEPLRINSAQATIDANAILRSDNSAVQMSATVRDISRVVPDLSGPISLTLTSRQSGSRWDVDADAGLGRSQVTWDGGLIVQNAALLRVAGRLTAAVPDLGQFRNLLGRPVSGQANLGTDVVFDVPTNRLQLDATGTTANLDLGIAALRPYLQPRGQIALQGTLTDGTRFDLDQVSVTNAAARVAASGRLDGANSAIRFDASVGSITPLVPAFAGGASVRGTVRKVPGAWAIEADGFDRPDLNARVSGTVSDTGQSGNLSASGTVDLAVVNGFTDAANFTGRARFAGSLVGPLNVSSVTGRIVPEGARMFVPSQNISLEDIAGEITAAGGQARLNLASRLSTGGRVGITGPVGLTAPFQTDIAVSLDQTVLRQANLFEARASGRLNVQGPAQSPRLSGTVTVAEADVQIPEFGLSFSILDGLRHLNPSAATQRTLRFAKLDGTGQGTSRPSAGLPLDVLVQAPSRIFVRGRGLDAEFGGSLRLTGTTNDLRPVGGFDLIRGRLALLGRRLSFDEGSIRLQGNFDPFLDVSASTTVDGTDIRLRLFGLASSLELDVSSSLDLPQDEALALLLFGRSLSEISPAQAVQVALSVNTLRGKGGGGLTERVRQGLGVDDFEISQDADGTFQARAGKYISDNVYSDVTVKSDGTSQINLNVDVSKNVTVRGRLGSDGETGIGIFFQKDY